MLIFYEKLPKSCATFKKRGLCLSPKNATWQEIFREKVQSFDQEMIFKKEDKYRDITRKYFLRDYH